MFGCTVAVVPPARLVALPVHEKFLKVSASAMLFPPVPVLAAVTVTTAPPTVAVTPTAGYVPAQVLIALARYVAMVEAEGLRINVPTVVLEQVLVTFWAMFSEAPPVWPLDRKSV